ncbi:uncharacterized protein [Argopecten irradians]|uniref:uncharacterized protein n=1 Tax=Argopecten irradians TaxID=31199 RepID=UPI0037241119
MKKPQFDLAGDAVVLSQPILQACSMSLLPMGRMSVVSPDIAVSGSSHKLTVNIIYRGPGSPQTSKLYYNVTNYEIFTAPDENGRLPLNIYLYDQCRSITHSSDIVYILHTEFRRQYCRLIIEVPLASDSTGQTFELCNFSIRRGHNIIGRFNTTIIKAADDMIEKVVVDISPLNNIWFITYDGITINYITMEMTVTYIDQSMQTEASSDPFLARLISNNKTIWTGQVAMLKTSIEYYQKFIVLTAIVKIPDVNPQNLWFHYSQNGSNYQTEKIVWPSGSNSYVFDFPQVITYYYFSTTSCTSICNITTEWLPLTDYMNVVKDYNNTLLRRLIYTLDRNLDTCFVLASPMDSPPVLWLRITQLGFFNVISQRFVVSITGEGIGCGRTGQRSLQVFTSGPAYNTQCNIDSEVVFCSILSNNTIGVRTQCHIQCECDMLSQCSDIHVVMKSLNNDDWKMCELSVTDA